MPRTQSKGSVRQSLGKGAGLGRPGRQRDAIRSRQRAARLQKVVQRRQQMVTQSASTADAQAAASTPITIGWAWDKHTLPPSTEQPSILSDTDTQRAVLFHQDEYKTSTTAICSCCECRKPSNEMSESLFPYGDWKALRLLAGHVVLTNRPQDLSLQHQSWYDAGCNFRYQALH